MTFFTRQITANYLYFSVLILCLCGAVSCKKPPLGDDTLRFSYIYTDEEGDEKYVIGTKLTVTFDTVFTSIGSVTRQFIVHNTSKEDIKTTIFLAGDKQSMFSINVNGMPGTYFKDVEISKKDSIFIFVKVNINPLNQDNPFLVTDSIVFLTGSRQQDVKLLAYGQDARYIVADPETGIKVVAGERETVRWTKDRPYVVYGWATIDSTGTLIIEPGTKVYFHSNSGLWAYRYSNLEVQGTLEEPVLFRGDRLENWFNNDYAQWSRIWINEGAEVTIKNAIITNASVGVQVEPLPTNNNEITITPNVVKIENTIIKNTGSYGVLSRFLNIEMTNCLIANNGASGLQLEGGQYSMKHLTIANYYLGKTERKVPTCFVSNKLSFYENTCMDVKADFTNCIIYGRNETEVEVAKAQGAELEVSFQNCLVKAKEHSSYFKDCLRNEDPLFTDKDKLDFTLQPGSPAIGKGKPNIGVEKDILGNPFNNPPDIGAYQSGR
jgi:hypothetical protein